MSQENVARQVLSPSEPRRHRSFEERLLVRVPALIRLGGMAVMRLPPRSRLRRALVRRRIRQIHDAWSRDDIGLGIVLGADPNVELHTAKGEGGLLAVDLEPVYHGHQGLTEFFDLLRPVWDETRRFEPEEIIDCGDKMVVRYRFQGRGKGSGVQVDQRVSDVHTLGRDARAVRTDAFWDHAEALEAAGLRE